MDKTKKKVNYIDVMAALVILVLGVAPIALWSAYFAVPNTWSAITAFAWSLFAPIVMVLFVGLYAATKALNKKKKR
jgi:uncharacterized membrane protein YiaA